MNIRSFVFGATVALLAVPGAAQEAAGKWSVSVDTPNGPLVLVFELLVDAAGKLTGSLQNEFFGSIPIKDAVLNGDELSFKVTFEGSPDGPLTIGYKGVVKGDELALTSTFEGTPPGGGPPETSFTARRAQ